MKSTSDFLKWATLSEFLDTGGKLKAMNPPTWSYSKKGWQVFLTHPAVVDIISSYINKTKNQMNKTNLKQLTIIALALLATSPVVAQSVERVYTQSNSRCITTKPGGTVCAKEEPWSVEGYEFVIQSTFLFGNCSAIGGKVEREDDSRWCTSFLDSLEIIYIYED